MQHVSRHDVVSELHVDSLTQQRERPLVGVNTYGDVRRGHPATLVARYLRRGIRPTLPTIDRPANLCRRVRRRRRALEIDGFTLTSFRGPRNGDLRGSDCFRKRMNK